MSHIKVLGVRTKEPRHTASSLLAAASQYFEAAGIIEQTCPPYANGAPNLKCFKARYFLWGHAIETALKAFLFLKGRSKKNLKEKKGHDLIKTLTDAESLGFPALSAPQQGIICNLNRHYFLKDFEYEEINYAKLPIPKELQSLTRDIINNVKKELLKR